MNRSVGWETKRLSNLFHRKLIADCGSTHTFMQGKIISYLAHHSDRDIFQRDLEAEFQIRRSTASGILQIMERDGLICRKTVACDARLKKLILTPKALALHHKIETHIHQVEEQAIRGLSEEELTAFFAVLDKIRNNFDLQEEEHHHD